MFNPLNVRTRGGALVTAPVLALCLTAANPSLAQDRGDTFYRAYYLEHEKGDHAAALELYEKALAEAGISAELRNRIERRMQACSEELATSDLAELAPADTILYVELNDPGEQLSSLLGQLGLLQGEDGAGGISVSPHLINGLLGLRGAAVAVTEIDPRSEMPGGVVILNPGDMDAVRGLIETALPAGGAPSEPISGHATYVIEGQLHVTMGERLIVAGTDRRLISDVLRRVGGDRADSLAANPALTQAMESRGDDLLYFCANAEPVMPMIQGFMQQAARHEPEAAMAMGLMDIESLRTLSGRIGVGDDGVSLDVGLELAEGHENIVFNLLRKPRVTERTYQLVPAGTAAFVATTMNEPGGAGGGLTDEDGNPIVTIMDLGREIFGNVVDVAAFTMPSMSEGPRGMPLPDAALVMSVNDAARSKAIWSLALGVAQGMAGGTAHREPRHVETSGGGFDSYDIDGVNVYLYADDGHVVIGPSTRAIEAAMSAFDGENVANDVKFEALAAQHTDDLTTIAGVSLGRVAEMARRVMPPRELAEVGPYLDLLDGSTVIATTKHSSTEMRVSMGLRGLPNVGPIVEQFVRAELGMRPNGSRSDERFGAVHAKPAFSEETVTAADVVTEAEQAADAADADEAARFAHLVRARDFEAAKEMLPGIIESFGDDANDINTFVWNVIDSDGGEALAQDLRPAIARANELTGGGNWYILDTYAHVEFALGRTERAIKLSKKAVAVARENGDARAGEAEAALEKWLAHTDRKRSHDRAQGTDEVDVRSR